MAIRALTMLNEAGDTTIAWSSETDDAMAEIIQKKMDQGVVFFLIEPRMGGLLPPEKTKLENAADALKHRALSIPDEHLAALVGEGKAVALKTPPAKVKTVRKTKDAKEAARSETVGVRPMRGG